MSTSLVVIVVETHQMEAREVWTTATATAAVGVAARAAAQGSRSQEAIEKPC